ncbi:hypothetical protein ABUS74_12825 [Vibrio cholerae]
MNPIDKITDPSFTSSTKGLLSLFCIGLFHLVIGVDLTETKIEIPWFPTVNFLYMDRLVYLYWLLVVYMSYRFVLHHMPLLKKYYFYSLSQLFKYSTTGVNIINRYVYSDTLPYRVITTDESESVQSVKIEHHSHGEFRWEHLATLEFRFSKNYDFIGVYANENPAYSIEEITFNKKEQKLAWGFNELVDDEGGHYLESVRVNDRKLRYSLRFGVLRCYLKTIMTRNDTFDLLVPLLLNAVLFVVWVACELVKH